MFKTLRLWLAALSVILFVGAMPAGAHEKAIGDFLNRIGGPGASEMIVTELVDRPEGVRESFTISSEGGKPKVTGNSLSAITTGIGWYLNHHAGINLSWNRLTTTFTSLPAPMKEETRTVHADFRHYLNYCTFSYSMSTWTWDRWQKEIDWMALHGINAPLQIVGLEEVWRKLLMEDYGYTKDEANAFVAGPSFMAWFSMNNLEGHGGPNPDWWYERQAKLGGDINARMRELGMQPVIPGFAGMVPSNFTARTGIQAVTQGNWCAFVRPYILATNTEGFRSVAANYYKRLHEVMGESRYYGIDPFHEGGSTGGVDAAAAYTNIFNALDAANPEGIQVMQQWQFSGEQWKSVRPGVIPLGRLVMLDLYSDGKAGGQLGSYNGHQTVYCMIPNFGARTGLFGRVQTLVDSYWDKGCNTNRNNVNGIGAVPEGIEQVPMIYDLLYEMAWMDSKPEPAEWVAEWAKNRYGGSENKNAAEAWELLRRSSLNCPDGLQGPHEAITCARPSLTVNSVSTWGGSGIFYDTNETYTAAYKMLAAGLDGNENYSYDLADITRQALADYSKSLLAGIKAANDAKDNRLFAKRRDAFLQLMLDIDELLNTNSNFMVGHWTERARAMADESKVSTEADRDWLEHENARTLITTWGKAAQANAGGLHDYSYRQWGGMMKDFYYRRWKEWFDNGMNAPSIGWYQWEYNWAHDGDKRYPTAATGSTAEVAGRVLPKYLSTFTSAVEGQAPLYIQRLLTTDLRKKLYDRASRGEAYTPDLAISGTEIAEIAVDLNKSTIFEQSEVQTSGRYDVPADVKIGEYPVRVTLSDGTVLYYTLTIIEEITEPRRVAVATSDASRGSVSIDGTDAGEVTNTEYVVLRARPVVQYDFSHWTDAAGNNAGNDNPMTYYGKEPAEFTAHFVENRWGSVPVTDGNNADIDTYRQWPTTISVTAGGETAEIFSSPDRPDEQFTVIPTRVKAAPGGEFDIAWKGSDGLQYMFFSAWADYDGDGIFETLAGTVGSQGAANSAVCDGSMKFILPFDAKTGTTHLRLRYDGAWNGGYDAALKAYPPTVATNRFAFDVILDIRDSPEYASTVTAKVNDPSLGTLRTENATNVYLPGETVIITAFPNAGAHLEKFVDSHGRTLPAEWMADGKVSFTVYGDAGITAVLALDPVSVNGWEFTPEKMADGSYSLTALVKEGEPVLDLSALDIPVSSIDPAIFAGNRMLAEVTLPDAVLMAPGATLHTAEHAGDRTANVLTDLAHTITGKTPWVMTIKGVTGTGTFNQWGTPLYANGTDATASDYSNGWSQFYLRKDGVLSVKWDGASENLFDEVILSGAFTIRSEFDGRRRLKVTVTNAEGRSQTKTITNRSTMKDISRYVNCIPAGMEFTLTFEEPYSDILPGELFRGCRSLTAIHAPDGSANYIETDGLLCNSAGKVVAYPEGRLFKRAFRLRDKKGAYVYVDPRFRGSEAVGDEAAFNSFRQVKASADYTESALSIWRLVDKGESGLRVTHANSLRNLGGVSGSGSTDVAVPADPDKWHGLYDYRVEYSQSEPVIDLFIGDRHLSSGTSQLVLAAATDRFVIVDIPEFKASIDATQSHIGVVSPLALKVPAEAPFSVNIVTSAADGSVTLYPVAPGTALAPFEPLIIARKDLAGLSRAAGEELAVSLPVYYGVEEPSLIKGNILEANANAQATPVEDLFLVDSGEGKLAYNASANLPAGTPYLPKSKVEEVLGGALTDPSGGLEFSAPRVVLDRTSVTIAPGATCGLKADVSAIADVKEITWSSSDTAVATVGTDGVVTGVKEGTAEITATVHTVSGTVATATCMVKVSTTPISGIDEINVDMAGGRVEVYDLRGHRLHRITASGVYIVGGRKVLVK